MKRIGTLALGLFLCVAWAPFAFAQSKKSEGPTLVGRITFVEGQLLRYVYDEKDWVATVKDAPFGLEDAVYANDAGKAEFKLPNGTWVRIGADSQIQLIALREDVTEVDLASGTARFYNKSQNSVIKATTPFGYVVAQPGTAFDLYVGDESTEVISLDGAVDFILGEGEAKYPVEAGGSSVISDGRQTVEGDGTVDTTWDEWNLKREEIWTQRVQVKGEAHEYLPPELYDNAHELEQNGRWERVYYQGEYRRLWRPTVVESDWQPFTGGRWTVWNDDNVWIPEEDFGYVTHHYGNWVQVSGGWYWAPPVRVRVGYVGDCVCWYPGRVAWIHSGVQVGWVPLAPTEVYYSHRYYGPASVFVGARAGGISIHVGRLAYVNHAVVVNQTNIYNVNNYRNVRITNINRTTIINNYRAAPVVNNTVINNYNTNRYRHVYNTNLARVNAKPHQTAVQRIDRNRQISSRERTISARAVNDNAARIRQGTVVRDPQARQQVQRPKVTGKIVPENQVNRPRAEVNLPQRQLKSQERKPQVGQQKRAIQQPGVTRPGQPGATGERGRPGERVGPGQTGERVRPDRPTRPGERVRPGEPGAQGERIRPERPTRPGERIKPGEPTTPGERIRPERPTRPGERVRPGELGAQGERVRPERPTRPGERVTPSDRIRPGGVQDRVGREQQQRDQRRLQQEQNQRQQQERSQRQQQLRDQRQQQQQERSQRQQQLREQRSLPQQQRQQRSEPQRSLQQQRIERQQAPQRMERRQRPEMQQRPQMQQQRPQMQQQRPQMQQQRPQMQQQRPQMQQQRPQMQQQRPQPQQQQQKRGQQEQR